MPVRARHLIRIFLALVGALPMASAAPVIAPVTVPAAGRAKAIVTIDEPGRYAISVTSKTGVAIELTTRMGGPEGERGQAGASDGRIDAFLDRGEYLVRTRGGDGARGDATLAVTAFRELNPAPPDLIELTPVSATLSDREQATFRMTLSSRRAVAIEAAGRSLRDLRLWRDGSWLIDAPPATEVLEASPGKPLVAYRIATTLEPGVYQLVAYGGLAEPWPAGGEANPLHVQWGIPSLPEASRRALTTGPLGVDRFLVPASATLYRLELAEASAARLEVGAYDPADPFRAGDESAEITKESVPPVAERELEPSPGSVRVVTVRAEAGTGYVLQHFYVTTSYSFERGGKHWVSSIGAGDPRESPDATAIVVRRPRNGGKWEPAPVASAAIEVGPGAPWRRRFNLIEPSSLLVRIAKAGKYEVGFADDAAALAHIEPYLLYPPKGYKSPKAQPGPFEIDLDAGLYRLTVTPISQGIATATLRYAEDPAIDPALPVPPPRAAARLGVLELDSAFLYRVDLGTQAGVRQGLIVRESPVAIATPLPLALAPGEIVLVPVTLDAGAIVTALSEGGRALELRVDEGDWSSEAAVATAGAHLIRVRAPAEGDDLARPHLASLAAVGPATPEVAPSRPTRDIPALTPGQPAYLTLARDEARTFTFTADRAGLYVVQTSGLLAMNGQLRTRLAPRLATAAENGPGRNFTIRRYLETGEYLVSMSTVGHSAGRVGISVHHGDVVDGGTISPGAADGEGAPGRATVARGAAAGFRFHVARAGNYRVRALTLGGGLPGRIEDQAGWPLAPPDAALDLTLALEPGGYRVVAEPGDERTRIVARVDAVGEIVTRVGHGPFPLALDAPAEHVWLEPERDGDAREPDLWLVTVPAVVTARIELPREMVAAIERRDGDAWTAVGETAANGSWSGELSAGAHRLRVTARRRDNRRAYTLALHTDAMCASRGSALEREVQAPATVPIAIGEMGAYELSSFGVDDVRATLYSASGEPVASNDDREDDWGFSVVSALAPGRYELKIEPVGQASAAATVRLAALPERMLGPVRPPFSDRLRPGAEVLTLPIESPRAPALLVVEASAAESVTIAILRSDGAVLASASGHEPSIVLPLLFPNIRLQVSAPERRAGEVQLWIRLPEPRISSEKDLARGIALEGGGRGLAVAALRLAPGVFTLDAPIPGLLVSGAPGRALTPAEGSGFTAPFGNEMWLAAPRPVTLGARRLVLGDGESTAMHVPAGVVAALDLTPAALPRLVRVHATAGEPGVTERTSPADPKHPGGRGGSAYTAGRAVAVLLPDDSPIVRLWRADRDAAIDLRVDQQVIANVVTGPALSLGITDAALAAASVSRRALPAGQKSLTLTLSPGMVVALVHGEKPHTKEILWSSEATLVETVVSDARTLLVLNPGSDEGRYRAEILTGAPPAIVTPGRPWIHRFDRGGITRLQVSGADPSRVLRLAGADARRLGLPAQPGVEPETVRIAHGAGTVVAWLEPEWNAGWPKSSTQLALPVSALATAGPVAYAIDGGAGSLLHVRGRGPLVTRLATGECGERIRVHPERVALDQPIAGPVTLAMRPLAGPEDIALAASTIDRASEGRNPWFVLPPGESRGFRFTVASDGAIGVGVELDSGSVTATLVTACGEVVADGVALMPTLTHGDYIVVVRAAGDGPPVRARIALAGLVPPGQGPPDDVVRSYLSGPEADDPAPAPVTDSEETQE